MNVEKKNMNTVCSSRLAYRPRRHFFLIVALSLMVLTLGAFSGASPAHAALRAPLQTLYPPSPMWTLISHNYSVKAGGTFIFYHDHVQIGGAVTSTTTQDCASVSFVVQGETYYRPTWHEVNSPSRCISKGLVLPNGTTSTGTMGFGFSVPTNAPTGKGYDFLVTLFDNNDAVFNQSFTYDPNGTVTPGPVFPLQ